MTTSTTWRKERGRETERLLAAYWRERGWPYAEPVGAGRPGADITGMPGLLVSAKATKDCSPSAWLRDAAKWSDPASPGLAFAVWRPDGMGEAKIGEWIVMRRLFHDTRLLRAAGYGDDDA